MLVVFLVFAGSTLFVNGVRLIQMQALGAKPDTEGRDSAVLNIFTGLMGFMMVGVILARYTTDSVMLASAAYIAVFALTYIWSGVNAWTGAGGEALGWFSLLVPFIGIPAGVKTWHGADSVFEYWMAVNWCAWSFLWFLYFLLLAKRRPIARFTGIVTAGQGILTALLPAVLSFSGAI